MTQKERKKYHRKGIFTVTQLSYAFRPRRRPRRLRGQRVNYDHALKALSIRERKTLIFGTPELKIEGTPVFLDVEGLPDRDSYYLIGVRINFGESAVQHSLWADGPSDEKMIWHQFLNILNKIEHPVLIHYGSYEKTFLSRMSLRYGGVSDGSRIARAINASLNLLSVLYAHIYLPVYSNRLKDTATLAGATWQPLDASGLYAIAWRYAWECTRHSDPKNKLIAYNRADCAAVSTLTKELLGMLADSATRPDVDFADAGKLPLTERGAEVHQHLKQVLRSAYSDYAKARIALDKVVARDPSPILVKRPPAKRRRLSTVKGRIVRVPRKRKCPWHPDHPTLLRPQRELAMHPLLDLVFTNTGCRKSTVNYVGLKSRCPHCSGTHSPPIVKQIRHQIYGKGFYAWVIYLRLALRLSYRLITKAT